MISITASEAWVKQISEQIVEWLKEESIDENDILKLEILDQDIIKLYRAVRIDGETITYENEEGQVEVVTESEVHRVEIPDYLIRAIEKE